MCVGTPPLAVQRAKLARRAANGLLAELPYGRGQRDTITYSNETSACEKGGKWLQGGPFNSENKWRLTVHVQAGRGKAFAILRGAPDCVLKICSVSPDAWKVTEGVPSTGEAM